MHRPIGRHSPAPVAEWRFYTNVTFVARRSGCPVTLWLISLSHFRCWHQADIYVAGERVTVGSEIHRDGAVLMCAARPCQ